MVVKNAGEIVRSELKKAGKKQYDLCYALGVSESTLIRWLRFPMEEEKLDHLLEVIRKGGDQ